MLYNRLISRSVIGAFAVQIHEAQRLRSRLSDWTFHSWRYFLVVVFVDGLSITTACVPYIRNLLLNMESGMIQTGHVKLPGRHGRDIELPLQPSTTDKMATTSSGNPDGTVAHGDTGYRKIGNV